MSEPAISRELLLARATQLDSCIQALEHLDQALAPSLAEMRPALASSSSDAFVAIIGQLKKLREALAGAAS